MPNASERGMDWRPVYKDLRRRIQHGEFGPGDPLPTIAALSHQTGLNRYGARRALERLRDDERAQSWQGRGYVVADAKVTYRVGHVPRFTQAMRERGLAVSTDFVVMGRKRPPHDLSRRMGLPPGSPVERAEMVRGVNGRPVALMRVHFPLEEFGGILDHLAHTRSVTEALAAAGVADFVRKSTELHVRLPTASESVYLNIPRSQPVIVTTGVGVDAADAARVVELNQTVWRADAVSLQI